MTSQDLYSPGKNGFLRILLPDKEMIRERDEAIQMSDDIGIPNDGFLQWEAAYLSCGLNPYGTIGIDDPHFLNDRNVAPLEMEMLTHVSIQKIPETIMKVRIHLFTWPYGQVVSAFEKNFAYLLKHHKIKYLPKATQMTDCPSKQLI
jgi:hypothetical protein